ncbi:MAG: MmcQ/YjbR family DNA-binding protein [Corynebacterium sp.]|nr:MmcQ/YjbR family DNA-binding protein [Corynebacterium sp.]
MNETELFKATMEIATQLPATKEGRFVDEWSEVRVGDKWFVLTTVHESRLVNLKAEPLDVETLTETYPFITRGYHMNKKHWISVYPHEDLTYEFLEDLIKNSYALVVSGLPKKKRPISEETLLQLLRTQSR